MADRVEFTITEEEMQSVLDASKSVPYMVFGGMEPASPRENANRAWQAIGKVHGIEWLSIRPVNEATRLMSGIPFATPEPEPKPKMLTFYASFGSGYRRTEWTYDQMGTSVRATRHPVFPDKIDGRGYVRIVASSEGRARYLARHYLKNQYSGLYPTTEMWDEWSAKLGYYEDNPMRLREHNGGSLELGVIDDDGLRWTAAA